ncbi:hypothetical protein B5S28_g1901 [[Candida] boidinii]|nr:hypothetical protein B5S28_g1901 [[Candida] boidinii]OWB62195.1 hypothetical protein B5S29_g3117 [[Candida] boidinii]
MQDLEKLYGRVGTSGLKVSKIIVGCMSFGSKKFFPGNIVENEDEVFAILKKCYDSGLRTFDTADAYSGGISERLLGKFLQKFNIPRSRVVIMTKCYAFVEDEYQYLSAKAKRNPSDLINCHGLSRKHIFDAVSASVERLGTYIDVLQIHRYDHETSPREIMKALNDVVEMGDVRYIGACSMKAFEFIRLQHIAEKNNWVKFINMQSYYNLIYREDEREMIPYCFEEGIGYTPWSPLAKGMLARPIEDAEKVTGEWWNKSILGLDEKEEDVIEILKRVGELAETKKVSRAGIAVAWLLSKGTYPIVGLNSVDKVNDIISALDIELTKEEVEFLEEPYKPKLNQIT